TIVRSGASLCVLEVTGRSGNTLTISGAIEGTTDHSLVVGDGVEMRPTALAITEIQAVIADIYDGTNILVTAGIIKSEATSGGDFVALDTSNVSVGPSFT